MFVIVAVRRSKPRMFTSRLPGTYGLICIFASLLSDPFLANRTESNPTYPITWLSPTLVSSYLSRPPPSQMMYPTLDGSPFVLPTIPDIALLAIGQYDWYQPEPSDMLSAPAESTWSTELVDSANSLSESLQFSSVAQFSPSSEPEGQSPMTVDETADLSPTSPEEFKSRSKSSGVVRQKRSIDQLPSGTYPYTRPEAKKDVDGVKRRKVWDHMLERRLFSPEEL